jgi:hypothetical protein
LLAKVSNPAEEDRIGNQTGGRVFLFLHTNDFWRDYRELAARGVEFKEQPREEPYGTVVFFEDIYGNSYLAGSRSCGFACSMGNSTECRTFSNVSAYLS